MSDDESAASEAEDVRLKFVEEKVCRLLRLQPRTWERSCASDDFLAPLHVFFEKGTVIFFWLTNKGCLLAASEVRFDLFVFYLFSAFFPLKAYYFCVIVGKMWL